MTKIKLCGLTRPQDMDVANELHPDYIGFVFAQKSRRYVPPAVAAELRARLDPGIRVVGVFVREAPQTIAGLLRNGVIDIAQLHGGEGEAYIHTLRALTDGPLIQAFRMDSPADGIAAEHSPADFVLLDSGQGGTGTVFDWTLQQKVRRPYFLAGGLNPGNAARAVRCLHPYAADVSSGIETGGEKDPEKMRSFVHAVRSVTETGKEEE